MAIKKGAVIVNTKMDYQKIKKDFQNLEKDTSKLIDKYNKSVDSIKSQELAISKVKAKLDELTSGNKTPTSIKNLETALKSAEKEVSNLENQYNHVIETIESKQLDLDFAKDPSSKVGVGTIKAEQAQLDTQSLELATQLEIARDKAEQLKKSLEQVKLDPENSTEAKQLSQQLENANSKLSQTKQEANETKEAIKNSLNNRHVMNFGSAIEAVGKKIEQFKSRVTKLMLTSFVFNSLRTGLTSLKDGFISLLNQNNAFSSSLNQIKANLMTAFAPIYNVCLPAINSLMNALSKITGTIATFTAGLFGISLKDAQKQAKGLSSTLKSTSGALKDTSKAGDEASGSLASFDHLEVIGSDSSNSSGASGGSGGSSSTSTGIDYSGDVQTSSKLLDFLNRIKESLSGIDFTNLNNALGRLKEKLSDFGDIVGGALWWVWENILVPLAKWTIEDVLPAFLDILSGALSILNQACTDLQPIWQWFWDNFLSPILTWTGGVIVDVLNGIGDALQWISENEIAMTILESLAIAIGLVTTALTLWSAASTIGTVATSALGVATAVLGAAVNFLMSPITLVVLAITALIAIIILCVKHWDEIKEAGAMAWAKIKAVWNAVATWFNNTVVQPVKNFFSGLWNGLKEGASKAWDGIKSVFSTVTTFFKNIFTKAWTAVKNVFSTGGKIFDGIKEGIVNAFKTIVNAIINGINKVVSIPFKGINTALKIVRDISILGVSPFKKIIKTIDVPQIPLLATGAVIPPRHEFAAILGDQKHGTNIEAPLETIKQANREVLQEFLGSLTGLNNNEREIVFRNLTIVAKFGNKDFSKIVVDAVRMSEKELGKQLFVS